jgi:hypothetical protein
MTTRRRQGRDDNGFTSIAFVASAGLALMFLVLLVQFAVWQYARGATRAAIDEAARTAARPDGNVTACETRAREAIDGLLGGPLRHDIHITCSDNGVTVTAHAHVTLTGWLPPTPDWTFDLAANATKEHRP